MLTTDLQRTRDEPDAVRLLRAAGGTAQALGGTRSHLAAAQRGPRDQCQRRRQQESAGQGQGVVVYRAEDQPLHEGTVPTRVFVLSIILMILATIF